jgi:hypothetical protein
MLRKRRTWLLLIALIGVALAVYFEPSHCVRGWLWGEAFFDGRPTSYWRQVVRHDLDMRPPPPWQWLLDRIGFEREGLVELARDLGADPVLEELSRDHDGPVARAARGILDIPERRARLEKGLHDEVNAAVFLIICRAIPLNPGLR